MNRLPWIAALATLVATVPHAGPVTTVPWNGHTGAVSFTYDDARASQLPNLIPQLDSLGLKATFFISSENIGNFTSRLSDWLLVAQNGHELANHTRAHVNVTDANAATVVKEMADYLRGLHGSIQSVTFAYPNCSMPGTPGKNGVSAENFIGRGCANASYAWGTQPTDWMNIQGLIMQPTNQSTGITLLNSVMTQNRWASFIIHDVTESPDQYSVTPANNRQLLTTAIANGLWIDTYLRISSYYRAHFTMDTATAVSTGTTGWRVQWTSPHARMPAKVLLRVKLDSTVFTGPILVVQGDTTLPRQSDGSYVIDFMKLRLDVHPNNGTAVSRALQFRHAAIHAKVAGKRLELRGLPAGNYAVSLHDASGRLSQQRNVRSAGTGEQAFYLAAPPQRGLYQLTVRSASGAARRVPLLILR